MGAPIHRAVRPLSPYNTPNACVFGVRTRALKLGRPRWAPSAASFFFLLSVFKFKLTNCLDLNCSNLNTVQIQKLFGIKIVQILKLFESKKLFKLKNCSHSKNVPVRKMFKFENYSNSNIVLDQKLFQFEKSSNL
jgi:hypothetical protein